MTAQQPPAQQPPGRFLDVAAAGAATRSGWPRAAGRARSSTSRSSRWSGRARRPRSRASRSAGQGVGGPQDLAVLPDESALAGWLEVPAGLTELRRQTLERRTPAGVAHDALVVAQRPPA